MRCLSGKEDLRTGDISGTVRKKDDGAHDRLFGIPAHITRNDTQTEREARCISSEDEDTADPTAYVRLWEVADQTPSKHGDDA